MKVQQILCVRKMEQKRKRQRRTAHYLCFIYNYISQAELYVEWILHKYISSRTVITPSGFVFVNPVCEQGSVPDAVLIGMAECQVMDGWLGAETRCVYFWVDDSHLPVPRAIPSAVFPHMCFSYSQLCAGSAAFCCVCGHGQPLYAYSITYGQSKANYS